MEHVQERTPERSAPSRDRTFTVPESDALRACAFYLEGQAHGWVYKPRKPTRLEIASSIIALKRLERSERPTDD
jgi:hypothetical protein